MLLLVAIIAAIALTLRQRKDSQAPSTRREQVKAKKADRVRIVQMKPEIERRATPPATRAEPEETSDERSARSRSATTCRSARSCSRCR